ncbi:MAG TPA: hypothetical protein VHJ38_10620 [Nitrososphaeraceae archaeon]|nr:hypothetical protein [Nitrososphaeraceae archaeon]
MCNNTILLNFISEWLVCSSDMDFYGEINSEKWYDCRFNNIDIVVYSSFFYDNNIISNSKCYKISFRLEILYLQLQSLEGRTCAGIFPTHSINKISLLITL